MCRFTLGFGLRSWVRLSIKEVSILLEIIHIIPQNKSKNFKFIPKCDDNLLLMCRNVVITECQFKIFKKKKKCELLVITKKGACFVK